ncbi:flagellar hook-length control protein FliK [Bacillus seohaeanensis]|uniref:Flagellar hook-length control protein FliK n=1 Tax=Bacillus seohaeanensis TaxID=284580 RepID=A0ABW5RVV6_9BACI
MNVGTLLTSVTGGGLGSVKDGIKSNQGSSVDFSNILGQISGQQNEGESSESLTGTLEGLMEILNLFQGEDLKDIPSLSGDQITELKMLPNVSMKDILSVLNVDIKSFTESVSQLHSELVKNIPDMKVEEDIELEELVMQAFQLMQQAPAEDMLKLNQQTMEETVKLAKIVELLGGQKDLHFIDARKVTELQQLLKSLVSKLESVIKEVLPLSSKWSDQLKQAYNRQMGSTETGSIKNGTNDVQVIEKMAQNPKVMESTVQKLQGTLQSNHVHFSLPKTEQFSLIVSETNRSGSFEKFVNEFAKVLGKSQLFSQPNTTKMLIKLYPENLGSLRIELLQQNGVMTAKILATTASAKELLDSQLHGLKQAFSSQNLPVEKIEIAQALSESHRQDRGQNQQQTTRDNRNDQQSSTDQQQSDEEEASFKELLMNIEI